jgi:hypothetical protein
MHKSLQTPLKEDMLEPFVESEATNVQSWYNAYSTLSAIESSVSWNQSYNLITLTAFMSAP